MKQHSQETVEESMNASKQKKLTRFLKTLTFEFLRN